MNRAVSLNSCILFYFLVLRGIQCRYWLFLQCVRSVNASSHWVSLFSDERQISPTEASREWANEANVQKTARGAKTVAAGIKYVVLWEAWGFKDFRDMCFMSVLWKLAAPGQVKKTEKRREMSASLCSDITAAGGEFFRVHVVPKLAEPKPSICLISWINMWEKTSFPTFWCKNHARRAMFKVFRTVFPWKFFSLSSWMLRSVWWRHTL